MKWTTELYDDKHDFVSKYGEELFQHLPNQENNRVLDLGCGTGTLTKKLSRSFQHVVGVDVSKEMIDKARVTYPELTFFVVDALEMTYKNEYDIVFSNAVFHWIPDHDKLLLNIKQALRPSGKLICEFGGLGNINTIESAFKSVLEKKGYSYVTKFNFSTETAFKKSLEKNNFIIDELVLYDRPTILMDGEKGLCNWATQFFQSDLSQFNKGDQNAILNELDELVHSKLWDGKNWIADYKRLRVVAHQKP